MFGFRPWKIARIFGTPISIDASWLLIVALLTFTLGTDVFPFQLRLRSRGLNTEALLLGFVASMLLFASVLAHELSHAWMAIRRGIPVLGITLFIFGGVAQIADEPDRPSTEFWVAIMGPLMSLTLAILFAVFWIWPRVLIGFAPQATALLLPVVVLGSYLAEANGLLVIFNLLPGFPLDGGRVLRAMLWAVMNSMERATLVAMVIGRVIAGLMIAGGLVMIVGLNFFFGLSSGIGGDINGLWFILIGGFLWQASGEAYRSVKIRDQLRQVSVARLMHTPVEQVQADLNLNSFVDQFLLRQRAAVFSVSDNNRPVGLISANQLRQIPRMGWNQMSVRNAMVPFSASNTVGPGDTALQVMQKLARLDGGGDELPVLADGQLVGVVGHEEISRYLQWQNNK